MIQRELDGIYFRFSTGNGVNTMVSPSLEGPWVDWGAALPGGSSIQLEGVDSTDIWVCELNPDFNNMYL
jgi:arabinan endo-1,5-alpha-L-arabinosidase